MLKERDKKILFYSWSYAILAAALIYACCGYGALAWSYNCTASGAESRVSLQYAYTIQSWYTDDYLHIEFSNANLVNSSSALSGTKTGQIIGSDLTLYGNATVTWDFDNHGHTHGTIEYHILDLKEGLTGPKYPLRFKDTTDGYSDQWFKDYLQVDDAICDANGQYVSGSSYLMDTSGTHIMAALYNLDDSPSLPAAPVINDFTSDATCYSPAEAIVLESDVTGSVDSWLWEIYNSDDVQVWSSVDSVETIVDEVFEPGLYQVQLYVENAGGNDLLLKDNWLNITQAGTCTPINNWTNPFPTQVTTIPTQQFYETMTMPPHIVTNMSGINEEINKGIFANMSQGYRDYIDYVGEQANTTFTGTFRTLLSPVTLVVNSISGAIGLFSTAMNSLTVYTTVPLAITAIVINYMPWQIVTLITAGIAIDAILIIIIGR